ncbi:MAG: hydroxymethylglutaryl-CoA reductase [Chloroflexia bacterium]
MPTIPPFMLNQLYVKGSLRDAEGCAQFTLRNNLASATITGLRISLDGVDVDPARVVVRYAGQELHSSELSEQQPIRFNVNSDVEVRVEGMALAPGRHEIAISPTTRELGVVTLNASDDLG